MMRPAVAFLLVALAACGGPATTAQTPPPQPQPDVQAARSGRRAPNLRCAHRPHLSARYRRAFTEGLFYLDGQLYESTGLVGQSTIRRVRLEDGHVLQSVDIPAGPFGEGIVDWGDQIISLTWQGGIGYRWDRRTLRRLGEWHYPGEGWALTRNATDIIMSDGTPQLRFLDPATLAERRRLDVTIRGAPLERLNELEWVDGAILANVWMTGYIVRIDPANGQRHRRHRLARARRRKCRGRSGQCAERHRLGRRRAPPVRHRQELGAPLRDPARPAPLTHW